MFRTLLSAISLSIVLSLCGCGGVPAEATGEPVPADYADQQAKAQEAAREAAMKNARKR